MKRRILAALVAVAMVLSVCTFASAEEDSVTPVYSMDFEDETANRPSVKEWWGAAGTSEYATVEGHDGNQTTVLSITNANWGTGNCGTIVSGLDASKTYTISLWHKGDVANLNLGVNTWLDAVLVSADWQELTYTFTGYAGVTLALQCQSAYGYMNATAYIDDIVIVEEATTEEPPATDEPGGDTIVSDKEAKILCIGDSITHGCGANDPNRYFTSYRYPLWKKLIDAGVKFEMVGPREGNLDASCVFEQYKGQTFNNKHYAQFGIKLEAMKETIGTDCANTDFNVAIINLGTNDRKVNNDTEIAWTNKNIPNWLAEMTNTLRTINPNVTVFLTGLIDSWPGTLNGYIEAKAEEISTTESPVYYIPAPAGWIADTNNPNTCTLDWCHPNEKGCQMMADTYYEALMENYFNAVPTVEGESTPTPDVDETEPSASAVVEETTATPEVEATTEAPAATTTAPTTGATTAPSVTPSSSATAAPSASPSTGTTTKKKVTIKFKKKSVKIKKGKKVTLKVTIKNAKKAKFSVDKKGKKVVKLSKKKAKSVVVTGKKKGKATITAKAGGKKATCKVKVK